MGGGKTGLLARVGWEGAGIGVDEYLGNHHVAVKGALAVVLGRSVDVGADLDHNGRAEGEVGDEVAVPAIGGERGVWW